MILIDLALFNQQIEGLFIYDMFGKIVFQEHFLIIILVLF